MIPGLRPSQDIDAETADALNNVILAEFQNDPRFVVVGGSDISALLEQESAKQLVGCTDDSCLAEVGEALGADILAKTSLGAVGSSYLLSINLIDVTSATPMRRISARAGRDDDYLIEAAQKAVRAVLNEQESNGVIVVGAGISRPAEEEDAPGFELGPPPAWPFAAAAGVGAIVAVGAAVTALGFAGAAYSVLNTSIVDPQYEAARDQAGAFVDVANTVMIVAGVAGGVSALSGGAAAGLFLLNGEGAEDDGTDATTPPTSARLTGVDAPPLGSDGAFSSFSSSSLNTAN